MLPEFPDARRKMLDLWNQAMFAAMHGSDPIMSEIPIRVQKEGHEAFGLNYRRASVVFSFKGGDAEGMSPNEFFESARKVGTDMAAEQLKGIFEKIGSGQTAPVAQAINIDENFSFQQILETWRSMDINFGTDGLPQWPTMVLEPKAQARIQTLLKNAIEDPECRRQWAELVAVKRKEFDEREARRRLVD